MSDRVNIRRALISVSDKTGLVELGGALAAQGVEILSTGGSARALREAGIAVVEVADYTGVPEMLDGRVKTLVPKIHGGLLGRRDLPEHLAQMQQHDIPPIDLLAVNLYPFEETVAKGADFETCVENIDIGGPALIRAAAKNHDSVAVLTSPAQYDDLVAALAEGGTTLEQRRRLAAAAYARTAAYDAAISAWFAQQTGEMFPASLALAGARQQMLRYGENPHQSAAFYRTGNRPGVATARQLQGKELSYNNINDTDAAFECVAEFDRPAVVIVKHANPCGVALGADLAEAWDRALECDPVSAFGGIIAVNRPLDAAAAEKMASIFSEVIIAPDAAPDAVELLARKKNLRLLLTGGLPDAAEPGLAWRSVAGGFLVQTRDAGRIGRDDLKVVTQRAPTNAEFADLLFAFRVAKHVKSNAIIYAKAGATTGIGAGQMSRVDSSRIAAQKGGEKIPGSVVASDAFFPFADGLVAAIEAGATAVIQPGGSIRDNEVIAAADAAGIAMVFTGMRHFRH
ncbi:MAG TPA: bifunctional phosphoribosylaminoimidazolecarboxamide formyltransferase/IMP cyclohydrolase [Acidiphilium sp.]|uniref:bifunctional phosphoribosylaminoimidazolecarboxamide formyltransferase/IMP cyclohydrolase n=1 Tax=unclassified Acidiphilium TaxID=2617493 RepID=UPI000BCD1FC2|nr:MULTISPECIES: bifunctional phosphoribosylaminoimidazolecarboxamide formyltransferase/IMP cyclohydrolase [unclassified Acidiphilium]OYV56274.1 MAG: bifunctional phosphoribosylaminoimidazolecarboxamide formyltransferase/IMP cyclohydrolase [Acidiphilium sp. 20-67-58]HQT61066.1 bifunctional phosphoribosylaminoimidazolecarboxamide formyltransferase/IMP cyclohydrolase [Acidiphilium sp.]HQU11962.1 bifunctional phosphoribosylaminoimidazolecarboxamide formyltransferase/IMP cyclohydrolase [Acidiphilium